MANDAALIGYFYFDKGIRRLNNTLATQAAFDSWVDGSVNEVFFPIADLRQKILPCVNINMTGATSTYLPTVVIEMNIIIFRNFY